MKLYLSVKKAFTEAAQKRDTGNSEYARFNRVLDGFGSIVSEIDAKTNTLTVDTPDEAGQTLKEFLEVDRDLPSVKSVRLKR